MTATAQTLDVLKKRTATKIYESDRATSITYHGTRVAYYDRNTQALILCTGGYLTKTTKERINDFCRLLNLGVTVQQKNNEWFISIDDALQIKWRDPANALAGVYLKNKKADFYNIQLMFNKAVQKINFINEESY